MQIFHNPRCRKSREALEFLHKAGKEPEIIEYLRNPPSAVEIQEVLKKLGLRPLDIIRKSEVLFKQNYKGKDLTDEQWVQVMAENPILIERPIVISGDKAVVGRPTENISRIID